MAQALEPTLALDAQALDWLLAAAEPGVRFQAHRALLGAARHS